MSKIGGRLDPRRSEVARAVAERKVSETMTQVAKRAGVGRSTLYRYLDDPSFCDVVREFTDHRLVAYIPQVDRAMVNKAIKGNVPAANYIAKRAGRLTEVIEDKTFAQFTKTLETADQDAVQFFMDHGRWPEDGSSEPH